MYVTVLPAAGFVIAILTVSTFVIGVLIVTVFAYEPFDCRISPPLIYAPEGEVITSSFNVIDAKLNTAALSVDVIII